MAMSLCQASSKASILGGSTARRTQQRAGARRFPSRSSGALCSAVRDGTSGDRVSRRSLLELSLGLAIVASPACAAEPEESELPKQYLKLAPKLVDSMLASLELEEEGASEFEVRKKADEAKPLVKEFVAKWKGDPRLSGDTSQDEIKAAMRELADHYMKNGQRAAVPRSVAESVRTHLLRAKQALPEVEDKGFLGLGF